MLIEHKSLSVFKDYRSKEAETYKTGIILLAQMIDQGIVNNKFQLLGKINQLEKGLNHFCSLKDYWNNYKNTFRLSLDKSWHHYDHLAKIWSGLVNLRKPASTRTIEMIIYLLCRKAKGEQQRYLFRTFLNDFLYDLDTNIDSYERYEQWCSENNESPIRRIEDNFGYCCEDCDGDLKVYTWIRASVLIKNHVSEFHKKIDDIPACNKKLKNARKSWVMFENKSYN